MNQRLRDKSKGDFGSQYDREAVAAELERMLASPAFRASDRIRQFLTYVIEETLEGRARRIKAYSIATEVFGRGAEFDPNTDPIVRIEAGRLRRALERYYLTEGSGDPLVIDIPKGSYVPVFLSNDGKRSRAEAGIPAAIDASVAIQTFRDLSENADHAYLAVGISEEISVALAQYPEVRVVPTTENNREASARYLGRKLGVQFVIGGSVRRDGDRIRVTAQLMSTSDGTQVWVETYDRDLSTNSLLEIQNDIAHLVVVNVAEDYGGAMTQSLQKRARSLSTKEFSVYEAILRMHHYNRFGAMELWHETRASLTRAAEMEPDNASVLAYLAEVTVDGLAYNYLSDLAAETEIAMNLARRAKSLEPADCQPRFAEGLLHVARRDRDKVLSSAEAILGKSPSVGDVTNAGFLLVVAGEYDRGVALIRAGLQELPAYPPWYHHALFLDHFRHGRNDDALTEARRFDMPTIIWSFMDRAVAYAGLGLHDEAQAEIDEITAMHPDFSNQPHRYLKWFVLDDELADAMIESLESANPI